MDRTRSKKGSIDLVHRGVPLTMFRIHVPLKGLHGKGFNKMCLLSAFYVK